MPFDKFEGRIITVPFTCMFGSQFFNNCKMAPLQSKMMFKIYG